MNFIRPANLRCCRYAVITTLAALLSCVVAPAYGRQEKPVRVIDQYIERLDKITENHTPVPPNPSAYGMDPKSGRFIFPKRTPNWEARHPFNGSLDYWDPNTYAKNVKVIAYYPWVVEPYHTWQNIVDFNGHRYLYQYVKRYLKIYDITYPQKARLVWQQGAQWSGKGASKKELIPMPTGDMFGAASVQWDPGRKAYIMVQSYEIQRFGLLHDKWLEPNRVKAVRAGMNIDPSAPGGMSPSLKGFKVYQMNGPLPKDWTLIAERTTDYQHPGAPIGQQQGSGARDIPEWFGGKYMFLAAAPSASYALTEDPNDLYSAGYQAWDMSDPANPHFLDQLTVPGQVVFDPASEAVYRKNPRAGNHVSYMGARMSLFLPKPVEQGGRYGYAAMGGLGFYIMDISDPTHMKVVSHLDFPPSVAGTEGDFINVSQVEKTGLIYYSGYPLNEDCYEPYKDVYIIDVKNPKKPHVIGTLPRPKPPASAPFASFCQRGGSFGPKRTGYYTSPGKRPYGLLIFNFYNAGVQIFDVKDPHQPTIAGYFVPPFETDKVTPSAYGNLSHGVYIEYDRNIIWEFTNHGMYALSTPLLGKPRLGPPTTPWPARN